MHSLFNLLTVATLLVVTTGAPAQDAKVETGACAECHKDDDRAGLGSPFRQLEASIHRSLQCGDCHSTIDAAAALAGAKPPHGDRVERVQCAECHEEESEIYKKHGRLETGKDPDLPVCASCHGTHDILPSSDRQSHVHPINLPTTCRNCHTNVDLVKKHFMLRDAPIKTYESSVHGQATQKGLYVAAGCNDCHSVQDSKGRRTAHRILSPADPQSTIYRFNIPDTCGKCHKYITQDYWEGIHGQYVKQGSADAPVCTNCHGEHGIISPRSRLSSVSASRLAEETCAPCHESALLNEKYGLPGGRLASYIDSYHGLKSKAGDATVANCASCHGSHRILPSSDAQSSIHPNNLRSTCGECHPGISSELAQAKIHETSTGSRSGWADFFRKVYLWLIGLTIGFMSLHNGADWIRQVRKMCASASVQRLSAGETAQHWVLMLSFTVLVITGFSLRFSDSAWVKFMFGWEGGFEARGNIHRAAAGVMTIGCIWHVFYLLGARGRHWFKDMMVARADVRQFGQNMAYFLGLRSESPRFARFTYMEKMEYWALVWGTVIMTGTGALLWFDNYFVDRWGLSKGFLQIMLVIHYYEAWLAFLAIVVWHIYGTMFKPGVYPMNPAWLTGRMPKEMYLHEHADGPRLKARTVRVKLEDEEEPAASATETAASANGHESDLAVPLADREPSKPS